MGEDGCDQHVDASVICDSVVFASACLAFGCLLCDFPLSLHPSLHMHLFAHMSVPLNTLILLHPKSCNMHPGCLGYYSVVNQSLLARGHGAVLNHWHSYPIALPSTCCNQVFFTCAKVRVEGKKAPSHIFFLCQLTFPSKVIVTKKT